MSTEWRDVLHDTALGVSNVFRPLKKGAREKLDVQRTWGRTTFRWRAPDQLGISDQSVLFTVLEVAAQHLSESPRQALATPEDDLWHLLGHQQHVFRTDTVRVTTSFARLARLCGWAEGGTADKRVRAGLRRLTETTVWATHVGDAGVVLEGSSRLLGWEVGDRNRVALIVNWRLAQALHGQHQFSRISLEERSCLTTESAQALHALLSCKINPGSAWNCGLDKLQVHIWGDTATGANFRQRCGRMRGALEAINQLNGWKVAWVSSHARITRASSRLAFKTPAFQSRQGVSVTSRLNEDEDMAFYSHSMGRKASNGAGFDYVDLTALTSTRG